MEVTGQLKARSSEASKDKGYHTVEYDPFIESQFAARKKLLDLEWCNFGRVTFRIVNHRNLQTPQCGLASQSLSSQTTIHVHITLHVQITVHGYITVYVLMAVFTDKSR